MPRKTAKNKYLWIFVFFAPTFLISCENMDYFGDAHSPHGVSNVGASGQCATVNENGTATLACPDGQTIDSIDFASYGTPEGSCEPGFSQSGCHAEDSLSIVEDSCLEKTSCSIKASNGVFGDPCRGTYKRLNVSYSCSGGGEGGNGLQATYFDNMDFTGATVKRVDRAVDFEWGRGSPDDKIGANSFSARWTGFVEADHSETYTFYVVGDDGIRLFVDGKQVVSDWSNHGPRERKGTIALQAGRHYPIKLEYYENGGGAVAKLLWSSSSMAKQIIPETSLFTEEDEDDEGGAIITASGEFFAAGEVKENAFDGDAKTKWLTFQDAAWIQYDFAGGTSKAVTAYSITSANDRPERDPMNWKLLGSNDGASFTTVDQRSGELFSARFQKRTFSTNNQTAFKIYRLDISSNRIPASASSTQLAEIALMEGDVVNDACPNDPDKTEPGICGCGTPDTDSDGDNTPDCQDDCPFDRNKTDSGKCGCGKAEGTCTGGTGSFSIGVLPDVQKLTMGNTEAEWLYKVGDFFIENKDLYNIKAVASVGDLVQVGTLPGTRNQTRWDRVLNFAHDISEYSMPFIPACGNHDGCQDHYGSPLDYSAQFSNLSRTDGPDGSPARYVLERDNPYFLDSYSTVNSSQGTENAAFRFEYGGQAFIILSLRFGDSTEDAILKKTYDNWVSRVLDENSDAHAIIITHWLTDSPAWINNSSPAMCNHDNVLMVVQGHSHGTRFRKVTDCGGGHKIEEYQFSFPHGTEPLNEAAARIYTFDLDAKEVCFVTRHIFNNKWLTNTAGCDLGIDDHCDEFCFDLPDL